MLKADRREAKRLTKRRKLPQHGKASLRIIASVIVGKGKRQ